MICRAEPLVGRLNAFQRVMLQWSELHAYNAAHTYELSGPLDLRRLRQAVGETLDHNDLGMAEIDLDEGWYRHEPDDLPHPPDVELATGDASLEDRLAAHLAGS